MYYIFKNLLMILILIVYVLSIYYTSMYVYTSINSMYYIYSTTIK